MSTLSFVRGTIRRATPALALGTAALTAALAACSDSPTGPAAGDPARTTAAFIPGPHRDIAVMTASVNVLSRTVPLAQDIVVQTTVNPGGGNVVNIPGTDAQINFPAHFVTKPTVFTITARAGSAVAYDFQPAGTFSTPVIITQRLQNTNLAGAAPTSIRGAYVQSWTQMDTGTNTATVNEIEPTTFDTRQNAVIISVNHFSGYIASWGRY